MIAAGAQSANAIPDISRITASDEGFE